MKKLATGVILLSGFMFLCGYGMCGVDPVEVICTSGSDCGQDGVCEATGCGDEREGTCAVYNLCAANYNPVCSCDGVTYSNACYAWTADASIMYYGECVSECEQQGGYCAHWQDICEDGYIDAEPMGCPMGRSGKCCMAEND